MAKLEFIENTLAYFICSSYKRCYSSSCRHAKPHTKENCNRDCRPYKSEEGRTATETIALMMAEAGIA